MPTSASCVALALALTVAVKKWVDCMTSSLLSPWNPKVVPQENSPLRSYSSIYVLSHLKGRNNVTTSRGGRLYPFSRSGRHVCMPTYLAPTQIDGNSGVIRCIAIHSTYACVYCGYVFHCTRCKKVIAAISDSYVEPVVSFVNVTICGH